ncbi:MAG: hypothetical protein RLZZ613_1566, partial [Pseudomonadota bacterium]
MVMSIICLVLAACNQEAKQHEDKTATKDSATNASSKSANAN